MEKNYFNNTSQKDTLPRKIVIKRIMAFSKSYQDNKDNKSLDILKNNIFLIKIFFQLS